MHLKDLQKQVHKWISQFEEGYWPPLSMFAALVEEVGELGREINHLEGFKPKKELSIKSKIIAASKVYENVEYNVLADTLGCDKEELLAELEKMIRKGRISAKNEHTIIYFID